ncbi:MAG: DUF2490 domain-containing protein [Flavobacteriales bacterium]|nr:DUF2490 domain-containing protein [Flavobacteriales bacterium]
MSVFALLLRFLCAIALLCFLCSSPTIILAQDEDPTVTQWNSWYMFFGNHRLSERWGLHTEYQWRREGLGACWQQSLLRIGADRYLKSGPMLSVGYAWIQSFPYGEQPVAYDFHEHRIWQQLILRHRAGVVDFQHRYLSEQRFLQRKEAAEHGYEHEEWLLRHRARYRFFMTLPLNDRTILPGTLFLAAYDEVFLGFGPGIGPNILDQNRLYLALGMQFTPAVQLQSGYLNHLVFKSDGIRAERNHTLQLALTINLDLRRAEEIP